MPTASGAGEMAEDVPFCHSWTHEGAEARGQPRRNRGTHSMDEGGERKLDDASSFQDGGLTLIQGFPSIDKGLNKH